MWLWLSVPRTVVTERRRTTARSVDQLSARQNITELWMCVPIDQSIIPIISLRNSVSSVFVLNEKHRVYSSFWILHDISVSQSLQQSTEFLKTDADFRYILMSWKQVVRISIACVHFLKTHVLKDHIHVNSYIMMSQICKLAKMESKGPQHTVCNYSTDLPRLTQCLHVWSSHTVRQLVRKNILPSPEVWEGDFAGMFLRWLVCRSRLANLLANLWEIKTLVFTSCHISDV